MHSLQSNYISVSSRIKAMAGAPGQAAQIKLLAVSKTQPASAIRALALLGQRSFGENYVQEALTKQAELVDIELEWHMIGPLQSNKCREVAQNFDWLQSLDRDKLIRPLSQHRPAVRAPLNVLIQVNIDAETSKSGCPIEKVGQLAAQIAQTPQLRLRGLMTIPEPHPDVVHRKMAFRRMRQLFDELRNVHPTADTLSMGMTEDFELAIAEGATMVRVGSALFGARD